MPTSAANLTNLKSYLDKANPASSSLRSAYGTNKTLMDEYLAAPSDYRLANGSEVMADVESFCTNNENDDKFVGTVREAFVKADATSGQPIDNGKITAALQAAGLSAAPRQAITVDSPVFQGKPLMTGWSDDPMCTATGHFVETEDAFVMPETLGPLRWRLTYSSRFIRRGAHGRGWTSWADTRLSVVNELEIEYAGPDGQRASFVREGEVFHRNPGLDATLADHDGGHRLAWDWRSRFPGQVWDFDGEGHLVGIVTELGRRVMFDWDGDRLVELRDQGGRTVRVEWEGDLVAAVVSSDGRRVDFDYGPDLVAIRREVGSRRFVPDAKGRVLELFDADGVRLAANTYDEDGRVVRQVSPHGRETAYRYLAPSTVVVSDEQGGPSTLYRHDDEGRLIQLLVGDSFRLSRQIDQHGNAVVVSGADGELTHREFDHRGDCVAERRPDGSSWQWEYDADGRLVGSLDPNGARYALHYDGDARRPSRIEGPLGLRFELEHSDGQLTRMTDADGVTTTMEYDADGCLVSVSDGLGNQTLVTTDPTGQAAAITLPTGSTLRIDRDAAGEIRRVAPPTGAAVDIDRTAEGRFRRAVGPDQAAVAAEYSPAGALSALTDARGVATRLSHDVFGRVEALERPSGRWSFTHEPMGELRALVDPTGGAWAQEWSGSGRLTAFTDPAGRRSEIGADVLGRITGLTTPGGLQQQYAHDANGGLIERSGPDGPTVRVVRDVLSRPTEVVVDGEPDCRITYSPAGRIAMVVRSDGASWEIGYDAAGRMIATEGPDGVTEMERDALGRVTRRVVNGTEQHYEWGLDGRPASVEADGGTWRYVWDAATGQVARVIGPGGEEVRSRYDERGDLVESVDTFGGSTRLEWDDQRNLAAIVDPKGARWTTARDALGRITGATDPLGQTTTVTRDAAGWAVAMVGPDGRSLRLGHDADGRLVEMAADRREPWSVDYLADGRDTSTPRGTRTVERHDRRGRLVERVIGGAESRWEHADGQRRVVPSNGVPYAQTLDMFDRVIAIDHPDAGRIELTRDIEGRLVALEGPGLRRSWVYEGRWLQRYEEELGGPTQITTFERDGLGRIVAEHRDGNAIRYRYDLAGQLVAKDEAGGSWAWEYDLCGRLITETGPAGTRRFHYDAADQLVRVDTPDGSVTYRHDAAGQRVEEVGPDGSVAYTWDGLGRLEQIVRTGAGTTEVVDLALTFDGDPIEVDGHRIEWSPNGPLGAQVTGLDGATVLWADRNPVAVIAEGRATWLSADWRGTVGDTTDPWGMVGPAADPVGIGFLGELQIQGLVWLRNRVYDPSTHTFLSRDPLAGLWNRPGGPTNPYQYAGNDPVGLLDPLGLHPLTVEEANKQMEGWKEGHWKQALVIAGAVVVGGALIIASGGAAAVVIPAIAGAVLTGGANAIAQYATTGKVDPWQLATATAAGFAGGAVGGAVMPGMTVGGLTAEQYGTAFAARYGVPFLAKAIPAAAEGGGALGTTEALTELGNEGTLDPARIALYTGLGAGGSVGGSYLGNTFRASRAAEAEVLSSRAASLSWWRNPIAKPGAELHAWGHEKVTNTGVHGINGGVEVGKAGADTGIQVVNAPSGGTPTYVSPSGVNWQFPGS